MSTPGTAILAGLQRQNQTPSFLCAGGNPCWPFWMCRHSDSGANSMPGAPTDFPSPTGWPGVSGVVVQLPGCTQALPENCLSQSPVQQLAEHARHDQGTTYSGNPHTQTMSIRCCLVALDRPVTSGVFQAFTRHWAQIRLRVDPRTAGPVDQPPDCSTDLPCMGLGGQGTGAATQTPVSPGATVPSG